MFENEKRPDTDFKPCAAVKKVKSGLVLGLTGEVSLIDWNTIIEADPLEETNSSPLLLQSSSAHGTGAILDTHDHSCESKILFC